MNVTKPIAEKSSQPTTGLSPILVEPSKDQSSKISIFTSFVIESLKNQTSSTLSSNDKKDSFTEKKGELTDEELRNIPEWRNLQNRRKYIRGIEVTDNEDLENALKRFESLEANFLTAKQAGKNLDEISQDLYNVIKLVSYKSKLI